ncbi:hypothetical protein D3C74_324240 [compost metagenome]
MAKELKMIYRTIAQTESGLTITAETKKAVTLEKAELDVEEHVLPKHIQDTLKPYVTLPISSTEGWKNGHVNFCPRCGRKLGSDEGTDSNAYFGDCFECGAELDITISNVTAVDEED